MDKIHSQVAGARAAALRIPEDLLIAGEMFSRNELGAMAGRGLVREAMGSCFVPTFFSYDVCVRARIAAYLADGQLKSKDVFCRQTAAWIHGLLPHASILWIHSPGYRRPYKPPADVQLGFDQLGLSAEDVTSKQRIKVTSLLRTVCDCAAYDPLPAATAVLSEVLRLCDPYLNLENVYRRLQDYPQTSSTARACRLVASFNPKLPRCVEVNSTQEAA